MTGRTTQGVILAKIKNGSDTFTSAAVAQRSDEDDMTEEEGGEEVVAA